MRLPQLRGPRPPPRPRPPPAAPARGRPVPLGSARRGAGAVPPQGLGSSPGLWRRGMLGVPAQAGSVIWGARMCPVPPSGRLAV